MFSFKKCFFDCDYFGLRVFFYPQIIFSSKKQEDSGRYSTLQLSLISRYVCFLLLFSVFFFVAYKTILVTVDCPKSKWIPLLSLYLALDFCFADYLKKIIYKKKTIHKFVLAIFLCAQYLDAEPIVAKLFDSIRIEKSLIK